MPNSLHRAAARATLIGLCCLLHHPWAVAQAASAPPQATPPAAQSIERPGDVYKDLMKPLDEVRASLDNWSPAELDALAIGIRQAQQYCAQVKPASLTGEDLYQLARVCLVGQQWNDADAAATAYIRGGQPQWQAHAYAIRINALLNLKDLAMATEVARSMLASLPYDAAVERSLAYLVHFLAMSLDDGALVLAKERQPLLLTALQAGTPLHDAAGDATVGRAALYDEALELVYLNRYAGRQAAAAEALAAVEAVLARVPPSPEDATAIARSRARNALLGTPLPQLTILRYLTKMDAQPRINPDFGSATVLLLFPEWCLQCRKMMQGATQFLLRTAPDGVHTYGLLALEDNHAQADPFKDDAFKDLLNTPTLATTAQTLAILHASTFPFAVVTDGAGVIRFLGDVPANAFDANGYLEQTVARITAKPAPPAAAAAPGSPARDR